MGWGTWLGLTHAKIFLVNLNNLLPGFWTIYCQDFEQSFARILEYARFIHCRESHLLTFCREIRQCARIGGWGGGVKPILAMPGFWKRLTLQPPLSTFPSRGRWPYSGLTRVQRPKATETLEFKMFLQSLRNVLSNPFLAETLSKYRVFFLTGTPPKSSKYKKVNLS